MRNLVSEFTLGEILFRPKMRQCEPCMKLLKNWVQRNLSKNKWLELPMTLAEPSASTRSTMRRATSALTATPLWLRPPAITDWRAQNTLTFSHMTDKEWELASLKMSPVISFFVYKILWFLHLKNLFVSALFWRSRATDWSRSISIDLPKLKKSSPKAKAADRQTCFKEHDCMNGQ